jgi:hypothetical protein
MRPLPLSLLACTALVGCGGTGLGVVAPHATVSPAAVRADTLARVAQRIYEQEVTGVVGRAQVRRIARDPRLTRALASGNHTALRAEALRQLFDPGKHVVRLEVLQDGRVRTDVGGRFVVGGEAGVLRAADGRRLGELELSLQDVLGYRRLVNRLTGAEVVIRGNPGHVETSLPAAAAVSLPSHGTVSLGGTSYVVREFHEQGFAGEPLSVWLLVPAS